MLCLGQLQRARDVDMPVASWLTASPSIAFPVSLTLICT